MTYWHLDVMTVMYDLAIWYLIAVVIVAVIALVLGMLTSGGDRDRG